MSGMHHDIHKRLDLCHEIQAINREFLRLLTHRALPTEGPVLGLEPAILKGLRRLSPEQLMQLAAAPLLLMELGSLRGDTAAEAPVDYLLHVDDARWRGELRRFADHLITCLWQFARQNPSFVAFILGLDREASQRLATVGFRGLSRLAEPAYSGLRARLSDNRCCWPDLIRATRTGVQPTLDYARLSLIPMSLAQEVPAVT